MMRGLHGLQRILQLSTGQSSAQFLKRRQIMISQHGLGIAIPCLLPSDDAYSRIRSTVMRMIVPSMMMMMLAMSMRASRKHRGDGIHVRKRNGIEAPPPRMELGNDPTLSATTSSTSLVMVLPMQSILQYLRLLHDALPPQYPPFVLRFGHIGRLDQQLLLRKSLLGWVGLLPRGNLRLPLGCFFRLLLNRGLRRHALGDCRSSEGPLGG